MCNNPNIDLDEVNAYAKFDEILSIHSEDIERKFFFTITKGHNSVANLQKWTRNNPNSDLVHINAYEKFVLIPSIHSQDIEWKRNSDNNQRP